MAYHFVYWLRVQGRRFLFCLCPTRRRMDNKVAFSILGSLFFLFVLSTYNCYSNTPIRTSTSPKNRALPQFIVDFFDAYKEETNPESVEMAAEADDTGPCTAKFSIAKLHAGFDKCASARRKIEVDMDSYLDAWSELNKFLLSMGKAFSFVSADVKSKIEILRTFRSSESSEHYETIEKMILYEKQSNLINYNEAPSSKVPASGSRTLLRLHRALKFLLALFGKLARNEDDGKVSLMAYNAYHASPMATYHPWIIRKAVGVAVYMLPDRDKFIKGLCQNLNDEKLLEITLKTSESMDAVYEYTHALYSKYEITEIP